MPPDLFPVGDRPFGVTDAVRRDGNAFAVGSDQQDWGFGRELASKKLKTTPHVEAADNAVLVGDDRVVRVRRDRGAYDCHVLNGRVERAAFQVEDSNRRGLGDNGAAAVG